MKGDFTRDTFNPMKHFSRVLSQQGRVQLDADLNEQVAILLHYMQTLAADIIGPSGGPHDIFKTVEGKNQLVQRNCGFEIQSVLNGDKLIDLTIGTGRYYVDGILCEHESQFDEQNQEILAYYYNQPGYPLNKDKELLPDLPFLVYLDVWERHLTALDDPDIREVALGGPDTATRAQVLWQVKTMPLDKLNPDEAGCTAIHDRWRELEKQLQAENRGMLKAKALEAKTTSPVDPCTTPPNARYRGLENQLYRVEIHSDGQAWNGSGDPPANTATLKWSRDNGSIQAQWVRTEGSDLIVSGIRDGMRGFASGQWVELTHDTLELRGEPGVFVRLSNVDDEVLTIDSSTATGPIEANLASLRNPKVRRWDQRAQGGTIPVREGSWIELEDGIHIEFQAPATTASAIAYRTGDYWLIPARTASGDVEWPGAVGNPDSLPPHGIDHHYAPLALFNGGTDPIDLRHKFNPAGECHVP